MLRSGMVLMIREKALLGKSAYAIAKETGLSKNTVKKYLSTDAMPKQLAEKRISKLDDYKETILTCIGNGVFNCEVIHEKIRALGYSGGITILKDFVKPYRPPKSLPAVPRYETMPGKQAQIDYGICHYADLDGVLHKVPAFIMILSHSRAKYVEFVKRCDLYSLQRCLVNAFEYYGGIPETILSDRMKTVVLGQEGSRTLWNTKFQEFANDMGFVPKLCKPRRPQTKGKVERLVHYVKDNFLPGRAFTDISDLNSQALCWCKTVDAKIHGTTGLVPIEELSKEPLLFLPPPNVLDRYRFETRKVSRDGFVSYDGVRYGVPWYYAGRELRVRFAQGRLEIFDEAICIADHEALYQSGRISMLPGQYVGLRQRGGLPVSPSFAKMVSKEVEARPLSVYDQLAEVM